jgi:predicted site-specific integrase-resolvase
MTMKEVCERVGLSRQTIVRWEKAGRIPPVPRDYKNDRVFTGEDVKRILKIKEEVHNA